MANSFTFVQTNFMATNHSTLHLIKKVGAIRPNTEDDSCRFAKRIMHDEHNFVRLNGIIARDALVLTNDEIISNHIFASSKVLQPTPFNKFLFLLIYNFYQASANEYWIKINASQFTNLGIETTDVRKVLVKLKTTGYIKLGVDYKGYHYVRFCYSKLFNCSLNARGFIHKPIIARNVKPIDNSILTNRDALLNHLLKILLKKAARWLFEFTPTNR